MPRSKPVRPVESQSKLGPTPRAYEAFFDEVAEVLRHLKDHGADNPTQTRKVIERTVEALPHGRLPDESISHTDVIASSSLCGGDRPCAAIGCRVNNANAGARFAALYAERIWLRDPFEELGHHSSDDADYVENGIGAIASFLEWKPLLVSGIAGHLAPVCPRCAMERIGRDKSLKASIEALQLDLLDEFVEAGKAVVAREQGEVVINVDLPPRYTGHRMTVLHVGGPLEKQLARFLGKRRSRKVPKRGRITFDTFMPMCFPTLRETMMQAMHRGLSGATYVSNLQIDLDVAVRTSGDADEVRHTARVMRALKHTVPIIQDVPVETVLRLRLEDEGLFQLYRSRVAALRGAVNDEKALREAADQLRSEFVTLETRIASRKKSVWGAVRDQAKVATGTVVAGLGLWLSHVLSPTWTGIAAAVGGIPAAQRVGSDLLSSMRGTPDEMAHPLYFLWKVKRAGRRGL